MRTRTFLQTLARMVALTLGVVLATTPLVGAQQPAQPPAAPPALNFTGDGGVIFWQIKPDKTADFEYVIGKLKEALQKSDERKAMAAGWHVYRTSPWVAPGGKEPEPGQNVLYLMLIDPAAKGADYSSTAILKILYDAFPSEGQDLYKKFTESAAGGRNVLNLQGVAKMGQ